jgi:hypothetical protein
MSPTLSIDNSFVDEVCDKACDEDALFDAPSWPLLQVDNQAQLNGRIAILRPEGDHHAVALELDCAIFVFSAFGCAFQNGDQFA